MAKTGGFLKDHPAEVSAIIVLAGLVIGALLGSTLGCTLFSKHMAFLHGEAVQSCGDSPVVLYGSGGVGGFMGAGLGFLAVVLVFHRGRLTVGLSLGASAISVTAFALYIITGDNVMGLDSYIFTGAFIALMGLALGAVSGMIIDHVMGTDQN